MFNYVSNMIDGEAMRHLAKNIDQRNELIRDPEFRKQFKAEIKKKYAPKVRMVHRGILKESK